MRVDRQVVLFEEDFLLRPPSPSDTPQLYEAVRESLAELIPWMGWAYDGYNPKDSQTWIQALPQWWADDKDYAFFIIDRESEDLLGTCGISQINRAYRFANLGYWLRSSQTGRGLATRATRLLSQWAFDTLDLIRLEIVVGHTNQASLRVANRVGAHREGVLRNRVWVNGVLGDAVMHSLIPEDLTP